MSLNLRDATENEPYQRFRQLRLHNAYGDEMFARDMNISELSRHCDNQVIRDFAHFSLKLLSEQYNETANAIEHPHFIPVWATILLSLVFCCVGCVGVVGNLLTVCVIKNTAALHSHTNYFLASLAISDLCLIVVGVPFDLLYLWRKNQPPDIAGYCEFMSTSISLFTFASILTIVSLTAERFVAICYPFSLKLLFGKRRVLNVIYAIWVIAFFPSLYIGLQFKQVSQDFCGYNHELGNGKGGCDYVTSNSVPFRYPFETTMLITFILPVAFIIYCYIRILRSLNQMANQTTVHLPVTHLNSDSSQTAVPSLAPSNLLYVHTKNNLPPKSQQAQKMVIKMLVTVTAVFFICYLPYHIERLIVQYTKQQCEKSTFCLLLYPITGLLQYISATLNPIFYNMMSVRFRNGFKVLFQDILHRQKEYSSIVRL